MTTQGCFQNYFIKVLLLISFFYYIYLLTCQLCFHFYSLLDQISEISLQKKYFFSMHSS